MLADYLRSLASAIESEVMPAMLTDLQERDLLLESFREGYRASKEPAAASFSKIYAAERKNVAFSTVSCIGGQLNEAAYLLTKQSEFCGAVKLHMGSVLRHCGAVLAIDGHAVMLLSSDRSQGLLLDFVADDPESTYELTVWGNTWTSAAMNCA
jgi:hypothetical protein